MAENLKKHDQTRALRLLQDRVAQCEACEFLATKLDLKPTAPSVLQVKLAEVQDVRLPLIIQVRIADHALMHQVLAPIVKLCDENAIGSTDMVKGMETLAKSLALHASETQKETFKVNSPCMAAIVHSLRVKAAVKVKAVHSAESSTLGLDQFGLGLASLGLSDSTQLVALPEFTSEGIIAAGGESEGCPSSNTTAIDIEEITQVSQARLGLGYVNIYVCVGVLCDWVL